MKNLLILGNDCLSSWLGYRLRTEGLRDIIIYLDCSDMIKRIIRLISNRRIKSRTVLKLFLAERRRIRKQFQSDGIVKNNNELKTIIQKLKPEQIICFRCGIIINKDVLNTGVPILNIHAADLPDFPGLGAIERAISAKAWEQHACLHYIDAGMDTGKILLKKEYSMKENYSYKKNEDNAYLAGIELAVEYIKKRQFNSAI